MLSWAIAFLITALMSAAYGVRTVAVGFVLLAIMALAYSVREHTDERR